MTNDKYCITVWCLIKGDSAPFDVTVPANATIYDLKKLVKAEVENDALDGIGAGSLKLWKVSGFSQL
jgi:Crinkler effector protein N-terminal domain